MATLIPVVGNDARNHVFMSMGGDKKAGQKFGNKWGTYAKNPGKSMWGSFKSIFGFGIVPCQARRGRGTTSKKKKKVGRPRKHKK